MVNFIQATPAEILSVHKTMTSAGVPVIGVTMRTNLITGWQSTHFILSMSNVDRLIKDLEAQRHLNPIEMLNSINKED